MKVCYVFPGQGSHNVGMGKDIYDKYPLSRKIFLIGNKVLGFDITDLMFRGPEEELTKTINCQPAILLSNLAYFFALKKYIPCSLTIGHSVGEYSALVASGALLLEDAIKLVKIRAKLMNECIPNETKMDKTSHMAVIITNNLNLVYDACKKCSLKENIVQVANINSSSQIVISGNNDAVIRAVSYLKSNKDVSRIRYLKVEGPFHSELMKPAAMRMKEELSEVLIKKPLIPYIANFCADYVYEPNQIKDMLVKQICGAVKWRQSLEKSIQDGFKTFAESGSGDIQTKLLQRDYQDKRIEVLEKRVII
ncbi:MAG: ACP S-malonyltransferase [Nanoarchaeota archaeon]